MMGEERNCTQLRCDKCGPLVAMVVSMASFITAPGVSAG